MKHVLIRRNYCISGNIQKNRRISDFKIEILINGILSLIELQDKNIEASLKEDLINDYETTYLRPTTIWDFRMEGVVGG